MFNADAKSVVGTKGSSTRKLALSLNLMRLLIGARAKNALVVELLLSPWSLLLISPKGISIWPKRYAPLVIHWSLVVVVVAPTTSVVALGSSVVVKALLLLWLLSCGWRLRRS